jgi:hypothetical protein
MAYVLVYIYLNILLLVGDLVDDMHGACIFYFLEFSFSIKNRNLKLVFWKEYQCENSIGSKTSSNDSLEPLMIIISIVLCIDILFF